ASEPWRGRKSEEANQGHANPECFRGCTLSLLRKPGGMQVSHHVLRGKPCKSALHGRTSQRQRRKLVHYFLNFLGRGNRRSSQSSERATQGGEKVFARFG